MPPQQQLDAIGTATAVTTFERGGPRFVHPLARFPVPVRICPDSQSMPPEETFDATKNKLLVKVAGGEDMTPDEFRDTMADIGQVLSAHDALRTDPAWDPD